MSADACNTCIVLGSPCWKHRPNGVNPDCADCQMFGNRRICYDCPGEKRDRGDGTFYESHMEAPARCFAHDAEHRRDVHGKELVPAKCCLAGCGKEIGLKPVHFFKAGGVVCDEHAYLIC